MILNDNNLAYAFNDWEKIYNYIFNNKDITDEVWSLAREFEEYPIMENIYQHVLLKNIYEWVTAQGKSSSYYVNCIDSHLYINHKRVTDIDEFMDLMAD